MQKRKTSLIDGDIYIYWLAIILIMPVSKALKTALIAFLSTALLSGIVPKKSFSQVLSGKSFSQTPSQRVIELDKAIASVVNKIDSAESMAEITDALSSKFLRLAASTDPEYSKKLFKLKRNLVRNETRITVRELNRARISRERVLRNKGKVSRKI